MPAQNALTYVNSYLSFGYDTVTKMGTQGHEYFLY